MRMHEIYIHAEIKAVIEADQLLYFLLKYIMRMFYLVLTKKGHLR